MRFLLLALSGAALLLAYLPAYAAYCGPDALGTSRTIEIDPAIGQFFKGRERALGLRDKEVILTFDDGPMRRTTAPILDALAAECTKATFFAVGTMLAAYPTLAQRIVRDGHTLAHHTHHHERLTAYSVASARRIVERAKERVEKVSQDTLGEKQTMTFFRYPYLAHNRSLDRMIAARGLIAFGANIDALDWKKVSPQEVHDRVMRVLRRERKGIILLHDIQMRTAKALPRILRSLKAEGFRVVHIVPGHSQGPGRGVPALAEDAPMQIALAEDRSQRSLRPVSRSIVEFTDPPTRASVREAIKMIGEPAGDNATASQRRRQKTVATGKNGIAVRRGTANPQRRKGWALRATLDADRWIIR